MSQKNISIPAALYEGADPNVLLFSQNLRNILVQFMGQTNTNISISNSDMNKKADKTTTITGAKSITGGGDLSANRTLELVNDAATPGNSYYYGTDGAGAKGYHALTSGSAIFNRNATSIVINDGYSLVVNTYLNFDGLEVYGNGELAIL